MKKVTLTKEIQVGGKTFYPGVAVVDDETADALEEKGATIKGAFDPTTSRILYVDVDNGSDRNKGESEEKPFETITAALQAASPGDEIVVKPGSYDENVDVDVDYVTVRGSRSGYGRPDVTPETGVPLTISGQGVVLRALRGASDVDDVLRIKGNGFDVKDCVMDGGLAADKGGVRFKGHDTDDSYTASEGVLKGNLIRGNETGVIFDTAEAAVGVGSTDNLLAENKFIGNTVDIATKDTGPGTYSVQGAVIKGNVFADKNKATYIDLTTENGGAAGAQTGIIADNFFATDTLDGTAIKAAGTGFAITGNRSTVGVVDGSGLD